MRKILALAALAVAFIAGSVFGPALLQPRPAVGLITLTTPPSVNSLLGGSAPVAYNKLVVGPFYMDPIAQTITGTLRLTSTGTPSMQPIIGSMTVSVATSELVVEVNQLDFRRRIALSAGQNTALIANIETAQKALEDGLISLGVISGTRTTGI